MTSKIVYAPINSSVRQTNPTSTEKSDKQEQSEIVHEIGSHVPYSFEFKFVVIDFGNFILNTGKRFIYWNGIEPRMCITETELIKELLSRYSTKAGKSWLQQQGSKHFIGRGLLMANGDDWHHQRHIVAPAFMGDRLKVRT